MDHRSLHNRYKFTGTIVLDTPLHVGGGAPDIRTDSTIVRDHLDQPYIPGSSLKGAFRSAAEALAWVWDIDVCQFIPSDDINCVSSDMRRKSADRRDYESTFKALIEELGEDRALERLGDYVCDGCQLFGSTVMASKVRFLDLSLTDGQAALTQIRDGVAIDRDSGNAADGLKFDYEVLPAGAEFGFAMHAENVTKQQFALLAAGIREMQEGAVPLGGNRSRGLGHCRLIDVELNGIELTDDEGERCPGAVADLVKYVRKGSLPSMDIDTVFNEALTSLEA